MDRNKGLKDEKPKDDDDSDAAYKAVDPDREPDLLGRDTGHPDDFEVVPGLTAGEIRKRVYRGEKE